MPAPLASRALLLTELLPVDTTCQPFRGLRRCAEPHSSCQPPCRDPRAQNDVLAWRRLEYPHKTWLRCSLQATFPKPYHARALRKTLSYATERERVEIGLPRCRLGASAVGVPKPDWKASQDCGEAARRCGWRNHVSGRSESLTELHHHRGSTPPNGQSRHHPGPK